MALSESRLEDITDTLSGPICDEVPPGEIFMCPVAHDICNICYANLGSKVCPTCRGQYGSPIGRNFKLERVIGSLPASCPYKCEEKVLRKKLEEHKKVCKEK